MPPSLGNSLLGPSLVSSAPNLRPRDVRCGPSKRAHTMNPSPIPLEYPFTEASVRALCAGDRVTVRGRLFTGRDRLHKHLAEGGPCPVALRDGGLFHCGPVVLGNARDGWRINAAGPTTSMREEPYMATVIAAHGLRLVMGKGGMGAATRSACQEFGCVYLQAVGGAAAVIARKIRAVEGVWFLDEFGPTEALWSLDCAGIEAVVGIDAHGRSLYDEVADASRRTLDALLRP